MGQANWQTAASCFAANLCCKEIAAKLAPNDESSSPLYDLAGFIMGGALMYAIAKPLTERLLIPINTQAVLPITIFHALVHVVSKILFPPKVEAPVKVEPQEETPAKPQLENLHDLVSYFDSKWDVKEKEYKGIEYNPERIQKNLMSHATKFDPHVDYKAHHGFIQKKEVPKGSKVFVRADLHGDLKSLLENLKAMQKEGLIDEKFKCTPGTYMVFCGDYMDRGNYSIEIAEVLALLQMENPDQVFLIRGNHEVLNTNYIYRGPKDKNFEHFIKGHSDVLTSFYNTMPLTVYLSEEGGEFVHFTHGLFELHTDPSELLDSSEKTRMNIPISPQKFSERVQKLAANASPVKYSLFSKALGYRDHEPSKYELAAKHLVEIHDAVTSETHSIYNWGDIESRKAAGINPISGRPHMTIEHVKEALRLMGSVRKVKLLFRGHQHRFQHEKHNGKIVATTLPVGADTGYYQRVFGGQPDRAYILDVDQKVKNWQKHAFIRKSGETDVEVTSAHPIFSEAV